jgi:hypothetical protein
MRRDDDGPCHATAFADTRRPSMGIAFEPTIRLPVRLPLTSFRREPDADRGRR